MITRARKADDVRVTFSLDAADHDGQRISVVGDFNAWDPAANPMRKRSGRHSATLALPPGRRYRFRYVRADGHWFDDDAADGYEPNDCGSRDCIVDLSGVEAR